MDMNLYNLFSNPDSLSSFNQMIKDPYNAIMCAPGTECHKNSKKTSLEKALKEAKENEETAPKKLDIAEKNYFTFVLGERGYKEMLEERIRENSVKEIAETERKFKEYLKETGELIQEHNMVITNYKHSHELFKTYAIKNERTEKGIQGVKTGIVTNDRKSYYENQKVDNLRFIHQLLKWGYILVAIIICYFAVNVTPTPSLPKQIGLVLFFVLLPFLMNWIVLLQIVVFERVKSKIPENVYLSLG
jgi:hypothetical protein